MLGSFGACTFFSSCTHQPNPAGLEGFGFLALCRSIAEENDGVLKMVVGWVNLGLSSQVWAISRVASAVCVHLTPIRAPTELNRSSGVGGIWVNSWMTSAHQ